MSTNFEIETGPEWDRVESFETSRRLFVRGFALNAVDTGSPGRVEQLFRFPGDHASVCEVSWHPDGRLVTGFEQSLYAFDHSGNRVDTWALEELLDDERAEELLGSGAPDAGDPPAMNWYVGAGDDEVYFVFKRNESDGEGRGGTYLGRMGIGDGHVEFIPLEFGASIDVDFERGVCWEVLAADAMTLWRRPFGGEVEAFDVRHPYDECRLSPDCSELLLSGNELLRSPEWDAEPRIARWDLDRREEQFIDLDEASDATWYRPDEILFCRGEHSLWYCDLQETEEELLFRLPPVDVDHRTGSYAGPPVVSKDGRWLAWTFHARDGDTSDTGTILADLESRSFFAANYYYHNMAWAC